MLTNERLSIKDKKLLTVKEAAEYLSLGESTLRKAIANNEIDGCFVTIGRTKLINRTKLDSILDNLSW